MLGAPAVVVRFDPDKPNPNSATIWLGYLVSRVAFREKHHLPMPASGEIIPSFEEEVDARSSASQIYRELKAKDAKMKDAYWETISEIHRRGFMAAYVWTFHHRTEWRTAARPSNLAAFNNWKLRALPKHTPQTYGSLEAGKP
jgi:hypothetical protein